jgi:glycosyl transferase family 87
MSSAPSLDSVHRTPARGDVPDDPSRSDGFVRGLSEAIGGPIGEHASRSPASRYGGPRFWTAARVVLALVCLTMSLHWVQKYPCDDGHWTKLEQYKYMCYTDVLALYYEDGLADGDLPYLDRPVEYPVVNAALVTAIGWPVHSLAKHTKGLNEGQLFYNLTALALAALAIATAGLLLAVRRRRPWDIAMFALAPGLFVAATVNWDLLAVGLTAIGWYFWAKRRPALAGVFVALGAATKLWPALLAIPLLALCWRARRMPEFGSAVWAGFVTFVAVNLPVLLLWPKNWAHYYDVTINRSVDWGTIWYIGGHFPLGNDRYGLPPVQWVVDHPAALNAVTWILISGVLIFVSVLTLSAPRRPRLAQVAFLTVALFLIVGKAWSEQFVLWLIPLAVLARPKWGAFIAWQAAEVVYFAAFYGRLPAEPPINKPIFPEWVFVWAAGLRLITLLVLVWFVVREILHPELDVVRRSYRDDPDGGVLDGAPDRDDVDDLDATEFEEFEPDDATGTDGQATGSVPIR